MKPQMKRRLYLYSFFNLGARRMWVVNVTPRPVYRRERETLPTEYGAGWAPGPVWTGAENLELPTGFCQTVENHYTDWAIPTHSISEYINTIYSRAVESLLNNDWEEGGGNGNTQYSHGLR